MSKSLDQKRASAAWDALESGEPTTSSKEFVALAKAAPALIMSNGLMQTLAFYQAKPGRHHRMLLNHLAATLADHWNAHNRKAIDSGKKEQLRGTFRDVMASLQAADSKFYMLATEEALETLRWIRQLAAARENMNGTGKEA